MLGVAVLVVICWVGEGAVCKGELGTESQGLGGAVGLVLDCVAIVTTVLRVVHPATIAQEFQGLLRLDKFCRFFLRSYVFDTSIS